MHSSGQSQFQAEEQFRLLVESVVDYAIFMLDPNGTIMTWNQGAERIKGYNANEIIGKHFSCFYSADDLIQRKPFKELEIAEAKGRYEEEGWRIRKYGSQFWASVVITAVRDNSGKLIGFSKVTRDLTERKQAEDALRESNNELERRVESRTAQVLRLSDEYRVSSERYRLMIECVKDYAIYTLDQRGCVTSWNEGAERIYGYTSAEILGHHRSLFFTKEDVARGLPQSELDEATTKGRFSEEAWRVRKDGSRFWANGSITAVRDDTGRLREFVKIVRDLTERKQAEIELQKTLTALQLRDRAVQAVPLGIVISDAQQSDSPIIYANSGFERLTGYSSQEVLNRNLDFLIGRKTDVASVNQFQNAIADGKECRLELIYHHKDGTPFWISQSISPVFDSTGRLIQFVAILADVTQRRILEDQLRQSQKMEAVGQLAGGVAHDFNNLLTVIIGYCDVLFGELPADAPPNVSVQAINEAAQRAADLTRQLLTFSRKNVIEPQFVDLNKLVEDTERMLRRVIGEDVELTTKLDPNIGRMRVDPGQIRQVLMNLVINARDAMPRGGKLTIETQRVILEEPYVNSHVEVAVGRYVLLSVSDTGTGMTPEVRSRIFEPFFTTQPAGKGTGLGLSVVHGIVKQSLGHIGAYTEFGLGTTFKIYLPVVDEPVAISTNSEAAKTVTVGSETVLLVEDEDAVRRITLRFLQAQGYTVLTATNGKDALNVSANQTGGIDLLVTDVVMPEMNGPELVEILRPMFPRMRVLFISGYTNDAIIRQGLLNAENVFLQKPYTSKALLTKVRQVLDQS